MSHAPSTTPSSSTPPLMHSWQSSRGPSESPLPPLNPSPAITGGTFGYDDLTAATDGFSDANLLGQGGFGHVYRGTLGGQEVAIKKLRAGSGQGDREFRAEVEIISRVHHKNLVSLVGYCLYGEQRLLVYEYVPNKTLEFHLHGKNALPKRIYLLNTTKKSASPQYRAMAGCVQWSRLLSMTLELGRRERTAVAGLAAAVEDCRRLG
jgi:hypothetical protein